MPETRQNAPISTWQEGDTVSGFALLSRKELRQDRNNKEYLDLELTDASGSMVGRVWSESPALQNEFRANRFVAFKGQVKRYRDQLQIIVAECREATEDDRRFGFDEATLVPSTPEDIDDLWARLQGVLADGIRRQPLRQLAEETLARWGEPLREHPAAKSIHHAYRGGLLEHVVSMAELATRVCEHYPRIDRDLVLIGVLFHDLGKLAELGAMPANDYTLEGRLVGHVVLGRDLLRDRCTAIAGFPDDLRLQLEHLVLSHQGRREFGSPVEPMTAEAFVLHAIDNLDAKLNQLEQARATGAELVWLRALGRHVFLPEESALPVTTATAAATQADREPAAAAPSAAEPPARDDDEPPTGEAKLPLLEP